MWTVKQICDNTTGSVLGDVSSFDFLSDYAANNADFDRFIKKQYGFRILDNSYQDITSIEEVIEEFKKDVHMVLHLYQYDFDVLYKSLDLDFNPIENYDKMSEIKTTSKGTVNERTGKETDTNTINGSVENLEFLGAKNSTITDQVRPWEVDAVNRDRSKQIYNDGRQDNETHTNYDNLQTTNNKTYDNVKDTKDLEDIVMEHTHGNIGVSTSASIVMEYRQLALFKFYEEVFDRIFTQVSNVYLM